jgi:hypothetical protein
LKAVIFVAINLVLFFSVRGQEALEKCWDKTAGPWISTQLNFTFSESKRELYHSPAPWDELLYSGKGFVSYKGGKFIKHDTLSRGKRSFQSRVIIDDTLVLIEEEKKIINEVTPSLHAEQLLNTARYTPLVLLDHFKKNSAKIVSPDKQLEIYEKKIGQAITQIHIKKPDHVVTKITTLEEDKFYGDIRTEFVYHYPDKKTPRIPAIVYVSKFNGKVRDTIVMKQVVYSIPDTSLLIKPGNLRFVPDQIDTPRVKVAAHNEHIYFLELPHAGTRILAVEFSDFFLVSDAPLDSENGELILSALGKIAPGKEIRYFTFGHWHQHYTGGIRPFIYRGAKILAPKCDHEIIRYLANAQHSLQPDSQQLNRRQPRIE